MLLANYNLLIMKLPTWNISTTLFYFGIHEITRDLLSSNLETAKYNC